MKLKPCPFCGEKEKLEKGERFIYCENCGAIGPIRANSKTSSELWNERS